MNYMLEWNRTVVIVSSILTFVVAFTAGAYYGSNGLLLTVSIGGLFAMLLICIANWHPSNLAKRVEAGAPIRWVIWSNNAEIGSLSDAGYATMQMAAVCDRRNLIAQIWNLASVLGNVLGKLLVAVPVLLFWGTITLALLSPTFFMDVVRELQIGDIASNLAFLRFLLLFAAFSALTAFVFIALMGYNVGFVNFYSGSLNRMLRQHCNIPEDVEIHLVRAVRDELSATA
jgi:hypothetical protein